MATKYFLECESGVAGDMLVGALLDLGANEEKLRGVLTSLPLDGYEIKISRVKKAGIDACDFDVILDNAHDGHDHDMDYLHGHNRGDVTQDGSHDQGEHHHEHGNLEAAHHHDSEAHEMAHHNHYNDHGTEAYHEQENGGIAHRHDHGAETHHHHHSHSHNHHHIHRHLSDINAIIEAGKMTDGAWDLAKKIFHIVAESEAKAHALPIEEVHFHEVGAVDSIVDIVAIAVCVDDLGIRKMIVPYLCEGQGTVRCQHGILPIPVPAVQNITEAHQIPLKRIGIDGEFVTPTGAAAVAALRSDEALPSVYTVKRTGIGAGKRNYERASLVRLVELEVVKSGSDIVESYGAVQMTEKNALELDANRDFVWKLETDIDDATGERLGYVMDALYRAGAREVHYTPIQMKKNRPGTELVVICDDGHREVLENIIFTETTTIGIRRVKMERTVLPRKSEEWDTVQGPLAVKRVILPDGQERVYPEYESAVEFAERNGLSLNDAWEVVQQYIRAKQR